MTKRQPQFNWREWTSRRVENLQDLTRLLWSATALLAPWLVPLGPATFFGWAMFQAAGSLNIPEWLAIGVGIVTAIGLEAVNIAAAHAAIQLWHNKEQHPDRYRLARLLVAFYVALGGLAVLALPIAWSTKAVGAALFLLTPVAITAQALVLDLARTRNEAEQARAWQREQEDRQAEWERGRALEQDRLEHERKVQAQSLRWQYKTQVALARPDDDRASPVIARRWLDKTAFLADPDRPHGVTSGQLAEMAGIDDRRARRWLAADRNGRG